MQGNFMQTTRYLIVTFFHCVVLAGCAAMFVPVTSDPLKKLYWAEQLYDQQYRPLPAEQLIQEAIDIYRSQDSQLGLAEAYRQYGFFFRAPSIEKWQKYYREKGFLDRTATFDIRYAKSLEYFEKAKNLFEENQKYDLLTNVYLNIGWTYELMNNQKAACTAFEQSLKANKKHMETIPNAKVRLLSGHINYEAFVASNKKRVGCA